MNNAARLKRAAQLMSRDVADGGFNQGGSTWTKSRATGAAPGTAPTITTSSMAIRFVVNGQPKSAQALPNIPIYTAPYLGIPVDSAGTPINTADIQAGDSFTNGTLTFLVIGAPDTALGFQRVPAQLA